MSNYTLKERTLPLNDSWDVIVIGGGPSGCAAATAAAREGARTLLIEATGALGGMGTSGLMPGWAPLSDGEKIIYRGLAEKIVMKSKPDVPHASDSFKNGTPINPEALKRLYDDLVTEAGASVLFNTMLTGVDTEHGTVKVVIVANKAGLGAYKAKVYVDCSGDADLAAWAGAEYEKGDTDGCLQPATYCFVLANVDHYAYTTGPGFYQTNPQSPIHAIVAEGKYPLITDKHSCYCLTGPDTVSFNTGHIHNVDNTDPASTSRALIHGRKQAAQYLDALRTHHKAYANSFLAATGALMGVRETRRIMGDYVLTVDDYVARRSFSDEIGRNCYNIDVHGSSTKKEKEWNQKPAAEVKALLESQFRRYQPGESHGIPYRCLTPRGLRNVLVAGRSISTDRQINGSIRVMPTCVVTGEAAGLAAALAASGESDVHTVDTVELRKRLRAHGAYLP